MCIVTSNFMLGVTRSQCYRDPIHIAPAEQYRTKKTDTVGTQQGSNGVSSSRIPEKN